MAALDQGAQTQMRSCQLPCLPSNSTNISCQPNKLAAPIVAGLRRASPTFATSRFASFRLLAIPVPLVQTQRAYYGGTAIGRFNRLRRWGNAFLRWLKQTSSVAIYANGRFASLTSPESIHKVCRGIRPDLRIHGVINLPVIASCPLLSAVLVRPHR